MKRQNTRRVSWIHWAMTCLLLFYVCTVLITASGCGKKAIINPTPVPVNYTTYRDEVGLFSISYPANWEPALSRLDEFEQYSRELVASMNTGLPPDQGKMIFLAGIPSGTGYSPSLIVGIEPTPWHIMTLDELVEGEMYAAKQMLNDYQEFSRVKTTVDGREAAIVQWEGTYPQVGKNHNLQMYILVGRTAWLVSCTPPLGEYDRWVNDFGTIARSLRILK